MKEEIGYVTISELFFDVLSDLGFLDNYIVYRRDNGKVVLYG